MLWRKRESDILDLLHHSNKALLITGVRQIGKTYLIKKVLEEENVNYVDFNLIEQPEIIELLRAAKDFDISAFISRLTLSKRRQNTPILLRLGMNDF